MSLPLRNPLRVRTSTACLRGPKPRNDDCLGVRIPDEPLLTTKGVVAVIADGVSVAEKGKEAAEICVQGFLNDYYDTPDAWSTVTAAQRVLNALNRWLYQLGQSYVHANRGFVTTLSLLVIKGRTGHLFHVGDSRIARMRDGQWEPLTNDHTARLSDTHRQLVRAMGLDVKLDVDHREITVREGDVYCLTTDGVHEWLPPGELARLAADSAGEPAERIVRAALERGGDDNASVAVLRIEALPEITGDEVYREVTRLPFPPELAAGMTLDGYRVERQLEASARSQVYLVQDVATGMRSVMKTPSVNYADDTAYLERFAMESWIAKCVDSPHVVKLVAEPGRQRFLYNLFEYVEGPTLAQWIERHPKPEVQAVRPIAAQIINGLRLMHRRELLHQDLKPDNIVIHPERGAVIIDLGSCYAAGIGEITVAFERDRILGTAHYSAPEYRLGRKPDPRSDQFALGVILYRMFTGTWPYGDAFARAQSVRDFAFLHYTPATAHNPLVPAWIDGVLRKAVQLNPDLRYESFSELLYDFEHPNPAFALPGSLPLLQRASVRFWRTAAVVLALSQLATWLWWLARR